MEYQPMGCLHNSIDKYKLHCKKACLRVSDQDQHKPGYVIQPMKMARGLKFRIYEVPVEELYVYSENKEADQLRGYVAYI